jgi:hypothetical protein
MIEEAGDIALSHTTDRLARRMPLTVRQRGVP